MIRECVEKEGHLTGAMISQGVLQQNHRDQDWKMREFISKLSLLHAPLGLGGGGGKRCGV